MDNLNLPPTFLLPTHLSQDELADLEDSIPSLTYSIQEAELVLGRISKTERALFELRRLKLETEPLHPGTTNNFSSHPDISEYNPSPKRRKRGTKDHERSDSERGPDNVIRVVNLSWLTKSLEEGRAIPLGDYLLFEGKKVDPQLHHEKRGSLSKNAGRAILARAHEDASSASRSRRPRAFNSTRDQEHQDQLRPHSQLPALLRETTSEQETPLPPIPEFLHTTYSCQRPTSMHNANSDFIDQLEEVRTLRRLQGDQVGVRAYSTCIATLSAYPYVLQSPAEIARLPGCGAKIATLFQEWTDNGALKEVTDARDNPEMVALRLFYNIWGVGDTTAREFYKKGWRDLDDLIEYTWPSLSRVQQIGIKYYDEFLIKIPRPEVESIAKTVLLHARRLDPGYQMVIVGGYRRGRSESGDVDVMLSHSSEEKTFLLAEKLVASLEKEKYVTHTLTLSNKNSERGQNALPWRGEGRKGSGFDTLDKALVVWQDPHPTDSQSNLHRRVDIIISPWKTAGCAVLGWSGGTTFQRDLRRYCKAKKGLKFDSSGVRSRADGKWVDMEMRKGKRADSMEEAEKWVFEELGLEYREPEQRCTG